GVPRGFFHAKKNLFAPRIGFAWDPTGSGKTSIRGGYGLGYSRIPFDVYNSVSNRPYIQSITLLNGTLSNPGAGTVGAAGPASLQVMNPDYQPTRVQTWSFTVQRELVPQGILSVAYVGSGSRHVKGAYDVNAPLPVSQPSQPGCLQAGQGIPAGGFDFDPCLNTGKASAQATRPFQDWANLNTQYLGGTSNYHSLQTGFQYRTGPVTFNAAYTWGKVLTDVANRSFDGRNTGNGAQNPRNFNAEYGPPGWDRTHIFTSGYVIELPFFKGSGGAVNKALGNWTFSGITVIESGFALAPGITGSNGRATRPNLVAPIAYPKTAGAWFSTSSFAAPGYGFYGNAGTGLIRGPGEQTWNWALFKTFPFNERTKLQFRAEAFNIWNHVNFSQVATTLGSGNFGQVTTAMEPRILEFALKLLF
ncbi:MAG TPA: hypothetical protein VG672_06020, partial [Bryobacteraceae bacterium]|nr:hypothetical protein [Bryobacteraceae bacterium]